MPKMRGKKTSQRSQRLIGYNDENSAISPEVVESNQGISLPGHADQPSLGESGPVTGKQVRSYWLPLLERSAF
jgi:hypothetical protein